MVGYDGTNTDNSVVEFELSEALPVGANVLDAQLSMHLSSATTATPVSVSAYTATKPWTTSATWSTYDGLNAWKGAGGDFINGSAVTNPQVSPSPGWVNWSPTEIVQEWVNGTQPNDGFFIADTTQRATNNVLSFDALTSGGNYPSLTITWQPRGQQDPPQYRMQPFQPDAGATTKVNVGSGDLYVTSSDLSATGAGPPLEVEHNYDSLNTEGGAINPWHNLPDATVYEDGSVTVKLNHYDYAPFILQSNGKFTAPDGLEATLCKVNGKTCKGNAVDGSTAVYALTFKQEGNGPLYKAGYKITFTSTGAILSDSDTSGNAVIFHHGSKGVESMSNTEGHTFTRSFTKLGNGIEATAAWKDNANGHEVKFAYNSAYRLQLYTDAEGHKTTYYYDNDGELSEVVDPSGQKTKLNYYDTHQIKTITGPPVAGKAQIWQYVYYQVGEAPSPCSATEKGTVVTGAEGHVFTFCVSPSAEVQSVTQQAAGLGIGPSATIDYSPYDAEIPAAVNAVDGDAILMTEDLFFPNGDDVFVARTLNTLTETPTALGPGWQQNWGPVVALAAEAGGSYVFSDPSGYRETFAPNGAGGYAPVDPGYGTLTLSNGVWVLATGAGDTYTFDSSGTLTAYEDANGGQFTASYTVVKKQQRLAAIQDPGGSSTNYKYNSDGTLAEIVSPSGEHFSFEYTAGWEHGVRLLAAVKNGASAVTTTISYSPTTWLPTEISLPNGHRTRLSYDWANRITKIEQVDAGAVPSDITTSVSYAAPANAACEAVDVGQTTVSGGQDEGEQTYCFNSSGQVTNPHGGE